MKSSLIVLLILFSSSLLASPEVVTFKVENRPSSDILSDIQDFLPTGTVAKAHNDLIILKIEANSIAQIKALIKQFDVKAQSVSISVMKTSKPYTEIKKLNYKKELNSISKTWSTHKDNGIIFNARGLSGQNIAIRLDKSISQQDQVLIINQSGDIGFSSQTKYFDITSGFKANAVLLNHGKVIVDITPIFSDITATNSVKKISSINTINGQVGHWLQLGHIVQTDNLTLLSNKNYSTHQQQSTYLYIKVDVPPPN